MSVNPLDNEGEVEEGTRDLGVEDWDNINVVGTSNEWTAFRDNLAQSIGFGYDSVKHCVVAEDQVWELYLQVHKRAGKWKNKAYPFYEDLCIVFGKDRTQGNRARDFVEAEEEVRIEDQTQYMNDESNGVMATSNIQGGNANMQFERTSSGRGKKRKRRVDPMADIFRNATLAQPEKFKVILMIRDDPEKVNMFWDLQKADREAYVNWVLNE
ncbi:uncharacterized protein At2g29880-like [Cynara cardunculus var. scolymus]|uniref:uncharacterized protein At2g29880-like n=1 Tax=Cynara cardunculus var. scolymus TaxID=59895 RepID=UPI000D626C9F|nr:uncharacterized protein At2g29880-like [Cynara cardunculus var. scolymus]